MWFHIIYAQPDFPFILCSDAFILILRVLYDLSAYIYPSLQTLKYHRTSAEGDVFEELIHSVTQRFLSQLSCILMPVNICHIQIDVRCAFIIRYTHVPQYLLHHDFSCHSSSQWWRLSWQSLVVCYPSPLRSPHSSMPFSTFKIKAENWEARKITPHYFGGPEIYPEWHLSVGAGKKLDPHGTSLAVQWLELHLPMRGHKFDP